MIQEDFSFGTSILHRRDPRVKIIAAACFSIQAALHTQLIPALASLIVAICFLLLSRLPLWPVTKRLLLVNTFTLFIWLTLPFTYQGESTISLGILQLSGEGISLATLITIKTNAALIGCMALLSTSTPAAIGQGLENLYIPQKLCFILHFAYRYIFVIYAEYKTLLRAARMRCFVPSSSFHTYRTFAYLFGMTLVRSHNRASRVHQAMLLRGFTGKLIPLKTGCMVRSDIVFLFFTFMMLACVQISSQIV